MLLFSIIYYLSNLGRSQEPYKCEGKFATARF
jgi:hypothetical protein